MSLNISKGNMYDFVTHTWNTIKGKCYHDCMYCYMKKFGEQKPVRFDESELKTNLGNGNFIFVGSSCDMFAKDISDEWIRKTLHHMEQYDNKYLLQTKNPGRILDYIDACVISDKCVICTTIESNYYYAKIQRNSPRVLDRMQAMIEISKVVDTYVTIEPILDFGLAELVEIISRINPKQVNIGADSGNNNMPEPSKEKILALIAELTKITKVNQKKNLARLLK